MAKKKYYETDSFKSINAEWKEKLQSSGFADIETGHDEYTIEPQKFTTNKVQSYGGIDYYRYCQNVLENYNFGDSFKGQLRRAIFELHTEGVPASEIKPWLEKNEFKTLTVQRINQIVEEIKSSFVSNSSTLIDQGANDYYQYCHRILREHPFESDLEKNVFEMHTEGYSVLEIEQRLSLLDLAQITEIIIKTKKAFGRT